MIRLTRRRTGSAVPQSFRANGLMAKSQKLVDIYYAALSSGQERQFSSAEWKPAKIALKTDTAGKCAYCEAPTNTVAHGDVEHFRPKSVYWWLAFCFDNYLFSCQICNQSHKGDKFPVSGQQLGSIPMPPNRPQGAALNQLVASLTLDASAINDAHITNLWGGENADLVHPYFEDPAPLFTYEPDVANEEMWVRSAGGARADRAMAASNSCLGINRPELRSARYTHYLMMVVLKTVLDQPQPAAVKDIATAQVKRLQESRSPFAGMQRWFALQWNLPPP